MNSAPNWPHFREIWYWWLLWKSVDRVNIWLKSDKINEHFMLRTKYIYIRIVDDSTEYSAAQQWKGDTMLGLRGNAQQCHMADSDKSLSSTTGTHCCVFKAANSILLHCWKQSCHIYIYITRNEDTSHLLTIIKKTHQRKGRLKKKRTYRHNFIT
jgi:hypothetical protein